MEISRGKVDVGCALALARRQKDRDPEHIANLCATCLDGDRARERFRFPVALAVPDASVRIRGRSPDMLGSRIGARTIARLEKRLVAKPEPHLLASQKKRASHRRETIVRKESRDFHKFMLRSTNQIDDILRKGVCNYY